MSGKYVWAPHAECVQLNVGGHLFALEKGESEWWHGPPILKDGDDYTFVLDGSSPLPDPRSSWQALGVAGASRHVDHSNFRWSDGSWRAPHWSEAIVYEVHIGTFTSAGTFDAAIDRLHHLQKLGATYVELMPVGQFPGDRGWGYDGVFPFAPQHSYGGPLALKRFVDACHSYGLAVLLDVVYNHVGPSGNVLPKFGPYFSKHYHTPWGPGFNFDAAGSDEVRRFICDNALMWLTDFHFDGLRIDSVHEMVDSSAVHVLEQLVNEVRALETENGRKFVLVGEDGKNNPQYAQSQTCGGFGFDAQWSNDVGLSLLAALTTERKGMLQDYGQWTDVLRVTSRPFVYEGQYSKHRDHAFGRPAEFDTASQVVVYGQNHDFLGNRREGDRLGHLADIAAVKIGAALTLLTPFTPLLFQGEDWNASAPFLFFADCHGDAKLSEGVEKGRKMAAESLGWNAEEAPDPGERETFERSKLDWTELEADGNRDVLRWYQTLIALRSKLDGFQHEKPEVSADAAARCFTIKLGPLVIVCNLGEVDWVASIERALDEIVLLTSDDAGSQCHDTEVHVRPKSIVIFGPREWTAQVRQRHGRSQHGHFTSPAGKA